MPLTFDEKLQRFADLAIQIGVGIQPGQTLIIRAPIEAAPLVRLAATSAYKAGAKLVDVMWQDDALTLARFQYAPRDSFEAYPTWYAQGRYEVAKNGGATLSVYAEDPDLLGGQDPDLLALAEKVAQTHNAPTRQLGMANAFNWAVISVPIPSWAAKIYPDDSPAVAVEKLWELIFQVCRVNESDPLAAWESHIATLTEKKNYLNDKKYVALSYRGPGTDFTLGLPENHIWNGADADTPSGIRFIANIPTEEVFTMPHKDKADGVVTSTKPLSYNGTLITNFSLTFEGGRVVKVTADTGEATLRKLVETDDGSARLGEVALVPHSSPISQSNKLFYNTLFDENASCHLALGKAYRFCMVNGAEMSTETFAAAGGNDSLAHVDFMIGSGEIDIDGLTRAGEKEAIMRGGEWVF